MGKSLTKLIGILILLILTGVATAQDIAAECQAIVQSAFDDMGVNCAGQTPNSICYGYGNVDGMFINGEGVESLEDFSEPGDIVDLTTFTPDFLSLDSVGGAIFNPETGEWGLRVINSQANIPLSHPSRGAVVIAFGDVIVRNDVTQGDVFLPGETVELPLEGVTVFTFPPGYGDPSLAIDTVTDTLTAHAVSPDGEWLRVYYPYERELGAMRVDAWVPVSEIPEDVDISELPLYGQESLSPIQSLSLTQAGGVSPDCSAVVPNGILIQGPENVETDFYVNGLHGRISSTVFAFLESDGTLSFTPICGILVMEPNTPNELVIPAGFTVEVPPPAPEDEDVCIIDGVINYGAEGCEINFTDRMVIPATLLDTLTSIVQGDIPSNILNYVPSCFEITRSSGIGGPQISITLSQVASERIADLCEVGILPEPICEVYR